MENKFYFELSPDSIMIRKKVFVEEQGFEDEFDDIDAKSIHLVVYENALPIANGRTYSGDNEGEFIIGRIAVLPEHRGKHVGERVVKLLECEIKNMGGSKISLSAQCHAQKFYEKLGYIAIGETFLEESCEHVHMEKRL